MPIISRNEINFSKDQLEDNLKRISVSDSRDWSVWFDYPSRIKLVLTQLALQVQKINFFEFDYDITTFLKFLQEFLKTKPKDSAVLTKFNEVYQQLHYRFISQKYTNSNQTSLAFDYLTLLQTIMEPGQRYLLDRKEVAIYPRNLKEIATVVSQSGSVNKHFIERYTSTLSLSFDSIRFLNAYQEAYEGISIIAKNLFLHENSEIHPLLTKLFSTLAYEVKLLDYYKDKITIGVPIKTAQERIVQEIVALQDWFFFHLHTRSDISKSILQHYFFHDFLKKTAETSLVARCTADLTAYCDANYTPLPRKMFCDTHLFPSNHTVVIEYANVAQDQLITACKAMACADQRHGQWLARSNISYTHFNTSIRGSDYIYRVFPDETSYKRDVYAFGSKPYSTGFYTSKGLIGARAKGIGYAMWKAEPHSWISVSGHEYAHHLNFAALRDLLRIFNEGLAYIVIHGICGDKGYISWLQQHIHTLTSLAPLLESDFIGYNPSFAFMSYLVDTQPVAFSVLLKLYQAGKNSEFREKLAELVRTDTGLAAWLQSQLTICSDYPLQDLRAGDCPSISLKDYKNPLLESSSARPIITAPAQILVPTRSQKQLPEPIFQDYLRLMHALNENNTTKINTIAAKTRYPQIFNYNDPRWGTPLFYVLDRYREKCPPRLIESLMMHGASPTACNKFGKTPYQVAQQICENWSALKLVFDRFTQRPALTTEIPVISTTMDSNTTELVVYKQKESASLEIIIPLPLSYFFSGALSASLDRFSDSKKEKYPFFPSCMTYGLKPILFSLGNSIYDSLVLGSASTIHVEAQWSSFSAYLAMNYMGLVIAQPVSRGISVLVDQKIINKYWNLATKFALQALTVIFLLNPGLFFSEEFMQRISFMMMLQIFNGVLFVAGELGTHALIDYINHSKDTSEASKKGNSTTERRSASQTEMISLISATSSISNPGVNAEALSLLPTPILNDVSEDSELTPLPEERFSSSLGIQPSDSSVVSNRDSGRGSSLAETMTSNTTERKMYLFRLATIKASLEVLQNKLQKFPNSIRRLPAFPRMFETPLTTILSNLEKMQSDEQLAFKTCLESFVAEQDENKDSSLKIIDHYLNVLETNGDMKNYKTHINGFRAELIIQINYINFLAQNWLEMLSPGFFVIAENEFGKVDPDVFLTKKTMDLVRGYFCKLERLTAYGLVERTLNLNNIHTALQALKSIFFHADLENIIDKPFPKELSQLIEQCARCATNFDLAAKQLLALQSEILNIEDKDLRTGFYNIGNAFKKICEQNNYFFTNRIDSIKAEEKGVEKGEKKTLEFIKKGGAVKWGDFSSIVNEAIQASDKGMSKPKPPLLSRKPVVVHNNPQGFFANRPSANGLSVNNSEGHTASTSFQEEVVSATKSFRT